MGLVLEPRGIDWEGGIEVDKNHPMTSSQKAMGLFSGSSSQGQTHTHLWALSDSWLTRRLLVWGWGNREGDYLTSFPSGGQPSTWKIVIHSQAPKRGRERGNKDLQQLRSEETVVRRENWPEMGQCSFNRPPLLQTLGGGEVAAPGDKRIRISKLCSNLGFWTPTLQGSSS